MIKSEQVISEIAKKVGFKKLTKTGWVLSKHDYIAVLNYITYLENKLKEVNANVTEKQASR